MSINEITQKPVKHITILIPIEFGQEKTVLLSTTSY